MESQNVEYKVLWRDEYLKWICGFANAQGGKIFIGIDDHGKIVGVNDAKKLMEDIPNKVRDVLGIVVDVNLHNENGLEFIEIVVEPSNYPINYKGEYHVRSGSTKQLLQGVALTQFLLKRTGTKWDAVPVDGIAVDDLDRESFDIFRREALKNKRMTEDDLNCDNRELLEKLDLLSDGKLKRAAVLLFYRNPEKIIQGCYTKIGMFNDEADILFMDEIHGSLLIQADRILDLLYLKYMKAYITYDDVTRVETYPFPKLAVREAVFNSLIHSNWAEGNPIQISVYDDKMFIANDCIMKEGWTADTLMNKHKSELYNPNIANTFFRAGLIEAWGRGIEKMCVICRKNNAPIPQYQVHPFDIMVRFDASDDIKNIAHIRNEKLNVKETEEDEIVLKNTLKNVLKTRFKLSDIQDDKFIKEVLTGNSPISKVVLKNVLKKALTIMILLDSEPQMTLDELSLKLNVSPSSVDNLMKLLKESDVIERKGPRKGGRWIVKWNE